MRPVDQQTKVGGVILANAKARWQVLDQRRALDQQLQASAAMLEMKPWLPQSSAFQADLFTSSRHTSEHGRPQRLEIYVRMC